MAAKNGLEPLPKRLTGARATLTLYRNKMDEILGIEPILRVSKTPLLPLQHIPIKMKQCDGLHSPILLSHRVH